MTSDRRESTEAALARLRDLFVARVPESLSTLTALADRLDMDAADNAALLELERELHRLRGTAGTFGFIEAARLAGELEETVKTWRLEGVGEAGDSTSARLRRFIYAFDRQVRLD